MQRALKHISTINANSFMYNFSLDPYKMDISPSAKDRLKVFIKATEAVKEEQKVDVSKNFEW